MVSGELYIGLTKVRSREQFQSTAAADGRSTLPSFGIAGIAKIEERLSLDQAVSARLTGERLELRALISPRARSSTHRLRKPSWPVPLSSCVYWVDLRNCPSIYRNPICSQKRHSTGNWQ